MLYRQDNKFQMPTLDEISNWPLERCRHEIMKLRTELAFIRGDVMHGGPARGDDRTEILAWIGTIQKRIETMKHGN